MESRVSEVEKEVTLLKTSLAVYEADIEKQKATLLDYINKEFATSKLAMVEIAECARPTPTWKDLKSGVYTIHKEEISKERL